MQVEKGLGACLLQEEKPGYFACKALTEAQKGYVAIGIKWLGQWKNSITFYMPVISSWKLTRNHLKLYCLRGYIKLLQEDSRY